MHRKLAEVLKLNPLHWGEIPRKGACGGAVVLLDHMSHAEIYEPTCIYFDSLKGEIRYDLTISNVPFLSFQGHTVLGGLRYTANEVRPISFVYSHVNNQA